MLGYELLHIPFQGERPGEYWAGVQLVVSMIRAHLPLSVAETASVALEQRRMNGVVVSTGGLDPHMPIVSAFLVLNHTDDRRAGPGNLSLPLTEEAKVQPVRCAAEPHDVARRVSFATRVSTCAAMARLRRATSHCCS